MSSNIYKIAVLGGGAFGTALAHISSRNQGNFVKIYARNPEVIYIKGIC
jgi:glycerol-3-phosphate dehydrogenase